MIIDGVKWACDACIRGHRVSGCTHSDRELKQIAKKGRPVSQCPHCRHMRKSRSSHVKCDCGERHKEAKKGQCCGSVGGKHATTSTTSQCVCCHGGRCICALKTEVSLNPVPEIPNESAVKVSIHSTNEHRRPRLQATQSESSLTTFANGHHKPTHSRHHGVHGTSPYIIPGQTNLIEVHANRHSFLESEELTARPRAITQSKSRRIKSEQSSPDLLSITGVQQPSIRAEPTPLSLATISSGTRQSSARLPTGLSVNTNHSTFPLSDYSSQEFLLSADSETHQFSAGLQPSLSGGWPSYDWINYPGLTSSSSGDETDDLTSVRTTADTMASVYGVGSSGVLPSDASDLADNETYRLSAASSYIGLPLIADGYLVDLNMPLDSKLSLERYLAESDQQQTSYLDAGLAGVTTEDQSYDMVMNSFLTPQSTDDLSMLASNVQSPVDSSSGLLIGPKISTEDDGLIWMRGSWGPSNYQQSTDQTWPTSQET